MRSGNYLRQLGSVFLERHAHLVPQWRSGTIEGTNNDIASRLSKATDFTRNPFSPLSIWFHGQPFPYSYIQHPWDRSTMPQVALHTSLLPRIDYWSQRVGDGVNSWCTYLSMPRNLKLSVKAFPRMHLGYVRIVELYTIGVKLIDTLLKLEI